MSRTCVVVFFAALVLFCPSNSWADVDAAKGYVKEAEAILSGSTVNASDFEKASAKIELAEAELDGVPEASKTPVLTAIKAVKDKIKAASQSGDKQKFLRQLTRAMDDAEGSIGNLATWGTAEREFNEVANNADAKTVIATELAAAAKKFATFKKLNTKKAASAHAEEIKSNFKSFEETWAEKKPELLDPNESANSKADTVESLSRSVKELRKRIADQLPAEDETAKSITARLDAISAEFTKLGLAGRVTEVKETLKRKIELYKDDWDGYDKETAGPSWEQYQHQQSEKMSKFLAPKSVEFVLRTDEFLKNLNEDEDYKSVQSDASIKAIIDDVTAKRNATYTKLLSFVTAIVEAADKSPVKDQNKIDNLESNVRLALGENSPEGLALRARLKKKSDDHAAAVTGAEDAKVKLVATLRAKAEEAWPKLYEGMTWIGEIDLSNPAALKGKNIGFLADNLMGYRFKPGAYYYATTIGGIPVAAKIDPMLKKQIDATEKAIGRSLGDDDGDGKWDIIAVVTDKKAKLLAKREAESTGKVGGVDVKIKTEYSEPVDAIIIEIIAAKCGPFAGVKDRGVLKEDGTVGK